MHQELSRKRAAAKAVATEEPRKLLSLYDDFCSLCWVNSEVILGALMSVAEAEDREQLSLFEGKKPSGNSKKV